MSDRSEGNSVNLKAYELAAEFTRLGRQAVAQAKEESRRLGVPNTCSINGRIYYELPNGELSLEDPGVSSPPADANGRSENGDAATASH